MRYNIILIILSCLFLLLPGISKGYDNFTTHPALTDEMIDFYNLYFDDKFTNQEKEWVVQGSIDEDLPPRWINHFYDPVNGDGWKAENLGNVSPSTLKIISRLFLNFNTEIVPSKDWAHNEILQVKYSDYGGNNTWENAIRRYVKGDKAKAYYALGHILHIIEDKTVPDHTRNDTHAHEGSTLTRDGGSPYEDYAKNFNRQTLNVADDFKAKNYQPIIFSSLNEYFDYLAGYSNKYFFSENTIPGKYENPKIVREDGDYGYGKDQNKNEVALVNIKLIAKENFDTEKIYTLKDNQNNNLILSFYFSRLSKEAILSGVGVINLFKEEIARAEKDKSLIKDEPKVSWWQKTVSPFYSIVNLYDDAKASILNFADSANKTLQNLFTTKPMDPLSTTANIGQVAENLNIKEDGLKDQDLYIGPQNVSARQLQQDIASLKDESVVTKISEKVDKVTNNDRDLIIHEPYQWPTEIIHEPFQGGVVASQALQIQPSFIFVAGSNTEESVKDNDSQSSDLEILEVLIDENQGGDMIAQDDNSGDESQVDDSSGSDDQVADDPSQGEQPLIEQNQVSDSQDDVVNDQAQDNLEIDLNPDIEFYLTDYDVRKSDFILNWKDENGVVKNWELQYKLAPNFDWQYLDIQGNVASPDEGSFGFTTLYDDLTYYFRLHGKDDKNNLTDWYYLQADISTKPIVINEVAWMGTQASATDEWIELANKTDQEIDLSGWSMKSSYGNINIALTGKIPPKGFYLLERTNDDPVSNIQADQIYTGDLNNPNNSNTYGQVLSLNDASSSLIDQAYAAWTGDNVLKKSSERISVWASGMDIKNWKTYIGASGEAQDASSNKISGTPKSKNSQTDLYHYLSANFTIDKEAIFLESRGPYVSDSLIDVSQSGILDIEPGTVFKFGYLGGIDIYGKFTAKGMADDKIVFTSFDDDEYGSDANGDGQTAVINWRKISFNEGSRGEISDSLFRYAGNVWTTDNEVFYINNAKTKISSSVFENMGKDVLHFEDSDADVSSSEFKNNKSNAMYIYGGKGDISGNVFSGNEGVGVYVDDTDGRLDMNDNSFTGNKAPIRLDDFGDFGIDSNQVSNNDYNGILVYAPGLDSGSVLLSADMPFVIMGFPTIQSGATLEVAPGMVIKFDITDFHGITVNGDMKAVGTQERPIVLTSLYDDEYGGDTNNDGAITVPRPGLWAWMDFAGSENSVLENTIIKYGSASRQSMGGPMIGGSAVHIGETARNFVLKNSQVSNDSNGMIVYGEGTVIENSSFSDSGDTGLSIFADNVIVNGATFNNNQKALQSDPATMASILLSNLIFNENIYDFWPESLIND